jgi:hypothetical protein
MSATFQRSFNLKTKKKRKIDQSIMKTFAIIFSILSYVSALPSEWKMYTCSNGVFMDCIGREHFTYCKDGKYFL